MAPTPPDRPKINPSTLMNIPFGRFKSFNDYLDERMELEVSSMTQYAVEEVEDDRTCYGVLFGNNFMCFGVEKCDCYTSQDFRQLFTQLALLSGIKKKRIPTLSEITLAQLRFDVIDHGFWAERDYFADGYLQVQDDVWNIHAIANESKEQQKKRELLTTILQREHLKLQAARRENQSILRQFAYHYAVYAKRVHRYTFEQELQLEILHRSEDNYMRQHFDYSLIGRVVFSRRIENGELIARIEHPWLTKQDDGSFDINGQHSGCLQNTFIFPIGSQIIRNELEIEAFMEGFLFSNYVNPEHQRASWGGFN